MKKLCDCEDWKKYISTIESGLSLAWTHFPEGYIMKMFNYCPWCGKELIIEEKEDETRKIKNSTI